VGLGQQFGIIGGETDNFQSFLGVPVQEKPQRIKEIQIPITNQQGDSVHWCAFLSTIFNEGEFTIESSTSSEYRSEHLLVYA